MPTLGRAAEISTSLDFQAHRCAAGAQWCEILRHHALIHKIQTVSTSQQFYVKCATVHCAMKKDVERRDGSDLGICSSLEEKHFPMLSKWQIATFKSLTTNNAFQATLSRIKGVRIK